MRANRLRSFRDAENTTDQIVTLAETFMWVTLQHHYRLSQASPPETSLGCEYAIEKLRKLRELDGTLPDPRATVEIGNEHLWQIVYEEPYPDRTDR